MRKKLTLGVAVIVIFMLSIIIANQVIIHLFRDVSKKLIVEYHELHSLQNLKISLSKVIFYAELNSEAQKLNAEDELHQAVIQAKRDHEICGENLTDVHKDDKWEAIDEHMNKMNGASLNKNLWQGEQIQLTKKNIQVLAIITYDLINEIIVETIHEINEYEERNDVVTNHGSITIVAFSLLLIIVVAAGGFFFIRLVTKPIEQLVATIQKIIGGHQKERVYIKSKDEFLFLANSFNSMLDNLEKTTVSVEYMNDILNSLNVALLVADSNCKIRFVNSASQDLFEMPGTDLLGKHITDPFKMNDIEFDQEGNLENCSGIIKKISKIVKNNGEKIPVLISSDVLLNRNNEIEGLIIVVVDITERKKQEKKIQKIKKAHIIAINEAQENERIRVAKDLHDGLGQILSGISFALNEINTQVPVEKEVIQSLHQRIDSAINEARNIAHNITPIVLKDFGLIVAITNLVLRYNQVNSTHVLFNHYGFETRIDERIEKSLYRISQEALNNITKHAKAKSASLELFKNEDNVVLVIVDDGVGFDVNTLENGFTGIGLISMRERVNAFDGEFTLNSQSDQGTELIIEIPIGQ